MEQLMPHLNAMASARQQALPQIMQLTLNNLQSLYQHNQLIYQVPATLSSVTTELCLLSALFLLLARVAYGLSLGYYMHRQLQKAAFSCLCTVSVRPVQIPDQDFITLHVNAT